VGRTAADGRCAGLARQGGYARVPIFSSHGGAEFAGKSVDAVTSRGLSRGIFSGGKLGEKIADERITLIDDGTIPACRVAAVRDEGVPTRRLL